MTETFTISGLTAIGRASQDGENIITNVLGVLIPIVRQQSIRRLELNTDNESLFFSCEVTNINIDVSDLMKQLFNKNPVLFKESWFEKIIGKNSSKLYIRLERIVKNQDEITRNDGVYRSIYPNSTTNKKRLNCINVKDNFHTEIKRNDFILESTGMKIVKTQLNNHDMWPLIESLVTDIIAHTISIINYSTLLVSHTFLDANTIRIHVLNYDDRLDVFSVNNHLQAWASRTTTGYISISECKLFYYASDSSYSIQLCFTLSKPTTSILSKQLDSRKRSRDESDTEEGSTTEDDEYVYDQSDGDSTSADSDTEDVSEIDEEEVKQTRKKVRIHTPLPNDF